MQSQVNKKKIVVITDLDGTLLDQNTYSYELSLPAVERLRARGVPLVFCSSKTQSEILLLWRALRLKDPFICENGGAIYFPRRYFEFPVAGLKPKRLFDVIEFGKDVAHLREALQQAARSGGFTVKSFGAMTFHEIMFRTGLTMDQAVYARQREYDEPFFIESGDAEKLMAALREKGLAITKGDRFYHLTGGHGKGEAVKKLLDLYRRQCGCLVSVGLGNSANDLAMLCETDIAVLIRNPDRSWDSEVIKHLPNVERTDSIGPQGWREVIDKILGDATA
ncbi:MAG: HAD-IIB family hydrolase [Deltaproteobacteria bacterium]|nr:HAD-IIB family hydrolase [Deltaproteobacteria bacterium]